MGEPDDEADDPGFRLPLPPDDRLWRHPSELHGSHPSFWWRLRHPWRVPTEPTPLSGDDGDGLA